ncbi:MAG TPA: pyridoxamine 5'-phosphate oxidase family protein [Burkholderiales bacterium]|jgi:nitroimidazol reductase NimA-like FMN-containing flavoprotein (pyridoxamine 5'-phosphate oxidase superfamily)|nr:pyridoxamine 5'-phosphate oxidase family protein [Burkholderiales bacterium]
MSGSPQVRRADKLMAEERARETLARGFHGRLATVGEDGWPYCVPLLYVCMDGEIFVHNTRAKGHLRANVDHEPRVCFEIDEAGEVFAYGRFECDSTVEYRSVIVFGRIRVVEDLKTRERFFDALMAKYAKKDWERPKGFYPRIDQITLYAIKIERMSGKETPLPADSQRWPAVDHTKSPNARA